MKLYFDVETQKLVHSAGRLDPVKLIEAKRGAGEYIAVQLLLRGEPWQAPGGSEMVFVAKKPGLYDSAPLASADTWTYDSATGLYETAINYEVTELDAMMQIGQTKQSPFIELAGEFAFSRPGLGGWRRSQAVLLRLENNVWRGTEDAAALPSASLLRPSIIGISADVVNNNAVANTMADVTGLQFPVITGKSYGFEFLIPYTAAATGTGSRWSINGPANTLLNYRSTYTLTATTETTNYASAYDMPSAAGATSLAAGNIAIIQGVVKPSADGEIVARFASEVAGSAITAKAGASVKFWELP